MSRKTNIIISSTFAILFIVSLFLPIMSLSFGVEVTGMLGVAANAFRLALTDSYIDYLGVMSTVFTPILLLILVIWSYRQELRMIPLTLLSVFTLIGGASWIFKYGGLNILLFGYYFWLILIVSVIGFNYFKLTKQKNVEV